MALMLNDNVIKKQINDEIGVVIYTDGSVRPTNPGFGGWGVHGYTYLNTAIDKPIVVKIIEDEKQENDIIAKKNNCVITNKGYISQSKIENDNNIIPVKPIMFVDGLGSHPSQVSNNYAELSAMYAALEYVLKNNFKYIDIFSDSQYVVLGITQRANTYSKRDWKDAEGIPIVNSVIWKSIYNLYQEILGKGSIINLSWVPAHVGIFGNELADSSAVTGMNYATYEQEKDIFIETKYKDYVEKERHPFIYFERVFFNSLTEHNKPGFYFLSKSNSNDFIIGKRLPKASYSIIKLNEPDSIIESVKQKQFEISNNVNSIIMMLLDKVYSKNIYRYLKHHGKYCLLKDKRSFGLTFVNKEPVTTEVNPTGLSLRAIESFNYLEDVLDKFLNLYSDNNNKLTSSEKLNWHNITDVFFTKEIKLKKNEEVVTYILNKEIDNTEDLIKINIEEINDDKKVKLLIPIILGLDILPRNNLKRLELLEPTIHLITWRESEFSLRYATVIQCSDSVGLWSNYFADRIIL